MDIDVSGLATVDNGGDDLAVFVFGIDQHRRADGIEIPNVMRDVLVVASVLAGFQVERDEAVGVQVVAGTNAAVEIRRWVADDEEDAVQLQVDGWVLPDAAAESFGRVAELGVGGFLSVDIAMHIAAGGVVLRPHARRIVGDGVELPELLAGLGIEGFDEAADTVFAAVRADEHFAVDDGWRHRFRVAFFRIADLGLPENAAGFGIECHELSVERCDEHFVVGNCDAAVVGAAAIGRDRTHLVLVVPVHFAGLRVERVDVAERGRGVHHAVDDDR